MTLLQLEYRLRRRLLDPGISIRLGKVKKAAGEVEWTAQKTRIRVNPMWVSVVGTTIHELLHMELESTVGTLGEDIEEICIEALGNKLTDAIYYSKRRCGWWERNIKQVLG